MNKEIKIFNRKIVVSDEAGAEFPLAVTFYAPVRNPHGDEYILIANINCKFFDRDIYGIGNDEAQSFFALPMLVVAYLIGRRRYGYEAYWFEKGDIDYDDFWLYRKDRPSE
jgi:hypothetical protein